MSEIPADERKKIRLNYLLGHLPVVRNSIQTPANGVEGEESEIIMNWIPVQIWAWLRHVAGGQHPNVDKVWKLEQDKADVDLFVIGQNKYAGYPLKYKVEVESRGSFVCLYIDQFTPNETHQGWQRYGTKVLMGVSSFIETQPFGCEKPLGKRSALLRY